MNTRLGPIPYRKIGKGPITILAIHGLLVDSRLWNEVANNLAKEATIILPDLPFGAHKTAVPKRSELTPKNVAAAFVDILDALDINNAMLIGNNSGGALCQIACVAAPKRFTSLVLTSCDAFENFPPKAFKSLVKICHLPGITKFFVSVFSLKAMFANPGRLNKLVRHPVDAQLIQDWTTPARKDAAIRADLITWMKSMKPSYTQEAAKQLSLYPGKTVVAWSREDKFFPPADAQRLVTIIPNSKLIWIDDALTFSPLDQPLAVANAVREII